MEPCWVASTAGPGTACGSGSGVEGNGCCIRAAAAAAVPATSG